MTGNVKATAQGCVRVRVCGRAPNTVSPRCSPSLGVVCGLPLPVLFCVVCALLWTGALFSCRSFHKRGWFYHKAVWLVLPGGKKVVLTARVHKPLFGPAEGELVLLEMPQVLFLSFFLG